jgi:Holliday junction DNA helicase RuvA
MIGFLRGKLVHKAPPFLVLDVQGVGYEVEAPMTTFYNLPLTILSGQSAEEFHRCIHDNDTQTLVRLPGVGKKTAERLIIEMRDRLPDLGDSVMISADNTDAATPSVGNPRQEAVSALCSLGYKPMDASKMVQNINVEGKSCEDIIRLALQGAVR